MLSAPSTRLAWPALSLAVAVAATLATATPFAQGADPINDPIPEKIPKGPAKIKLEPIASGLVSPVLLVPFPGTPSRLVVVDQAGQLRLLENGKLVEQPFLDLTSEIVKLNKDFDERGLLGLAFDPDFAKDGSPGHRRIFTYSSEPAEGTADFPNPHMKGARANHHAVIASWKVDESGTKVDPASRANLMRIEEPQFNHNGGMVAFGPDGFLYISLGDGGAANDLGPGHNPEIGNSQDPNVVLGKLLRIDVNGKNAANGKYGIPKDNPYAESGGAREIYALGLRNVYRFTFTGGQLLAGDVGQNKLEYLYRIERGGNYGWRLKEGSFKFNLNGTIEKDTSGLPEGLKDPILQYDHDEGTSIIGGYIYRGAALGDLKGKYIFADYRDPKVPAGRLFYGDLSSGEIREFENIDGRKDLGMLVKG
ncbi:MAG: PQQ-dependent sugar dehydrogenase, partial [Chthoniobacteraceae bacterium]